MTRQRITFKRLTQYPIREKGSDNKPYYRYRVTELRNLTQFKFRCNWVDANPQRSQTLSLNDEISQGTFEDVLRTISSCGNDLIDFVLPP